ncbi:MAG: cation-translocating P-type ATPase C-terminal domain-containing protein, partial [Patescibacteria group bacterium]
STLARMLLLTVVMTVGTIIVYRTYLPAGVEYARTVALTTVVFFQLFNLLNSRSDIRSVFKMPFLSNQLLIATLIISVALHMAAVYLPAVSTLLQTVPISANALIVAIIIASSIIVVDELRKLIVSSLLVWAKKQRQ